MGNLPTTAQFEQIKSCLGKDELTLLSKMFDGMSARSPGKKTIEKTTFLRFFQFPGMFGERLYQLFDLNKDGVISFDEFIIGISRYLHGSREDKLRLVFQLYDLTGDGYISPDELQVMLYSLVSTPSLIPKVFERLAGEHPHERGSAHKPVIASLEDERLMKAMVLTEVKEIFAAHDLDGDGKLCFQDFKHWVDDSPSIFNQLDSIIGNHLWHKPGQKNQIQFKSIDDLLEHEDFHAQCRNCQFSLTFCPLCGHKITQSKPLTCQNKNCKLEVFSLKTAPQYCLQCGVPWGRVTDPENVHLLLEEREGGEDESKYTHCGYLSKKRRIRGFKTKFYVVRGAFLYSFEKQNDPHPKSVTFLDGLFIEIHKHDAWAHKKYFGFDIITPSVAFTKEEAEAAEKIEEEQRSRRGGAPKILDDDDDSDPEDDPTFPGHNHTFTLYARTAADRILWVRALRRASRTVPFSEHYKLGEVVGQGRFANVHRAIHIRSKKEYAAKVIPKSKLTVHDAELLRREIAILALLDSHPNILSMKETFENSRSIFIVMPLEMGGTALQRLQKIRVFSEKVTRRLIWQILDALEYLHDRGIVHRDIKPENILLRNPEDEERIQPLLIDFGLSKWARPSEMINVARGTIVYIAPEVILGRGYTNLVDVWGCGVLMYIFLTGRLPFLGETENDIITAILEKQVPLNLPIHRRITEEGLHLVRRLLTKDPASRITLEEAFEHPWFKLDTPELGPAHHRVEPPITTAMEIRARSGAGQNAAAAAVAAAAVSQTHPQQPPRQQQLPGPSQPSQHQVSLHRSHSACSSSSSSSSAARSRPIPEAPRTPQPMGAPQHSRAASGNPSSSAVPLSRNGIPLAAVPSDLTPLGKPPGSVPSTPQKPILVQSSSSSSAASSSVSSSQSSLSRASSFPSRPGPAALSGLPPQQAAQPSTPSATGVKPPPSHTPHPGVEPGLPSRSLTPVPLATPLKAPPPPPAPAPAADEK